MSAVFIFLSSLLALVSYIVYIKAIISGDARPHRTTRFVMVLITSLATASLIAQNSSATIWLSVIFTVGSLIIFGLSLKYGMGGTHPLDLVCMGIAVAGVVLWQTTSQPIFGLAASIGADIAGQIPMLIKTYRLPESEVWTFYFLDVLAAVCTLIALKKWVPAEYIYPIYIIFIDGLTILLILRQNIIRVLKLID